MTKVSSSAVAIVVCSVVICIYVMTLKYLPSIALEQHRINKTGVDCLKYDHESVRAEVVSNNIWGIYAGNLMLARMRSADDAELAVRFIREHRAICFVGRRTDGQQNLLHTVQYWMAGAKFEWSSNDCIPYSSASLRVAPPSGGSSWLVKDGKHVLVALDHEDDAHRVIGIIQHYSKQCFIGRPANERDRHFPIQYWE